MWFWFIIVGISVGTAIGYALGRSYSDQAVWEDGFWTGWRRAECKANHPASARKQLWRIDEHLDN